MTGARAGSAAIVGGDGDIADVLAAVVDAIGCATFPQCFLTTMRTLADVELCSVFRRPHSREVELLFAAGERPQRPGFPVHASQDYARSYWRSDTQLAPLWRAPGRRPLIVRRRACEIADPSYRSACYERAGITDRISILWPGDPCFVANGYRSGGSASAEGSARLERYAGVLIAALRQHDRATAQDAHLADEGGVVGRLLALGSGLSTREAEVAAALILGETQDGIARAKHLSPATVVTYRRRAYGKLGVADRQGLVALHRSVMAGR